MSNKAPAITTPKGGGAQSGLGEKFNPDLFTGTGNFSVPVALPPGRNGLQPELTLGYSSGSGNSAYGLGWNLSVPGITRKTSRGIPVYNDAQDVFILSGSEDLVMVKHDNNPAHIKTYYRPRTEGLYARIVHHIIPGSGLNYWEVRSKDGMTSYYGNNNGDELTENPCTISNPEFQASIFAWKLYKTVDPFGNHIKYKYIREQSLTGAHVYQQLYLSEIWYADYLNVSEELRYLSSVKLSYESRSDAFSEYKSGFGIRTTLRCTKIETFTHPEAVDLPDGYPTDPSTVIGQNIFTLEGGIYYIKNKTYDLKYNDEDPQLPAQLNGISMLNSVKVTGHALYRATWGISINHEEMPPLIFRYSGFDPQKRDFYPVKGNDLPSTGLNSPDMELVDLTGNGLPDILQMNGVVRWWRNKGNGEYDVPRFMNEAPAGLILSDPNVQMIDANGDGRTDLLVNKPGMSGYFSTRFGGTWDKASFRKYQYTPSFSFEDPEVKLIDLDGDGVTDVLRNGSRFECFYNHPEKGFYRSGVINKGELDAFPDVSFSDSRIKLADMSGDGMQDILFVNSGSIAYWPNLGYGRFGKKIVMKNSPRFPYQYDPKRILFGDLDGDGLSDIVYIDNNKVTLWINKSGNEWSDPVEIKGTPAVTDMDSVRITDLLGSGVSGVLWSSVYNSSGFPKMFFLDFTSGNKPYLLQEMNNNMGSITRIEYTSSIQYYLTDEKQPETRWKSELPFPVLVVSKTEIIDEISKGKMVSEYSYHHGYWDGTEREFRGFGRVDQRDTETFEQYNTRSLVPLVTPKNPQAFEKVKREYYSPPTETRSWFHQGAMGDPTSGWYEADYSSEYWKGDRQILTRTDFAPQADRDAFATLPPRARRDALRTLRGTMLRSELYALDRSSRQDRPYTVTESMSFVRKDHQPATPIEDQFKYASGYIFFPYQVAQRTTQWERGIDPMTTFSFSWDYDAYGQGRKQLSVGVARGIDPLTGSAFQPADGLFIPAAISPKKYLASYSENEFIYKGSMLDDTVDGGVFIMNRSMQSKAYDCTYTGSAKKVASFFYEVTQGSNILNIISHTLNYYDGSAFVGMGFGEMESYGALVRSETLIISEAVIEEAYGGVPETLQDKSSAAWGAEYPGDFTTNYPARGGYLYYDYEPYTTGFYQVTVQNQYDFHNGTSNVGIIEANRDPFNADTIVTYDAYRMLPIYLQDREGYTTSSEYDYRLFQPSKITDVNDNKTLFDFSPLGHLKAAALIGKGTEGDYKGAGSTFYQLYEPSVKYQYNLLNFYENRQPVWVKTIKREHHLQEIVDDDTITSIEYSDGFGRVVQMRTQAEDIIFGDTPNKRFLGDSGLPITQGENARAIGYERDPGGELNVVVSGWQIYNNKGKVVEKFEPFFHTGFDFVVDLDEIYGPDAVCPNTPVTFSAAEIAGNVYSWSIGDAIYVSGENTNSITIYWENSGEQSVALYRYNENANGIAVITNHMVYVYPQPAPELTSSASLTCTNMEVTLSANNYDPLFTYNWDLGSGATIISQVEDYVIVQWSTPGTKHVSVTVGTTMCDISPVEQSIDVEVVLAPIPDLTASQLITCVDQPVTISTDIINPVFLYTWDVGPDAVILSDLGYSIEVQWPSSGFRTIFLTIDNGSCTGTGQIDIEVRLPANPSITASSGPVCVNMTVTLYANDYQPDYTYSWALGPDAVVVSQNLDSIDVYWTSDGTKSIVVTVFNGGCSIDSASFDFDVKPYPNPVITGPVSPPIHTPTLYTVLAPVSGNSYNWSFSSGANIISGMGTHTLVIEWLIPASTEWLIVDEDNGSCSTTSTPLTITPV